MEFSYNMKLLLLDENNKVVEDQLFLDEVKNILCQSNSCTLFWNGKYHIFSYQWIKKDLDELEKYFMGDLFLCPIYTFENVLEEHVQQILSRFETKYSIIFYIHKIIGEKKICKDCFIIKRDGIVRVLCDKNPRHKQRQG